MGNEEGPFTTQQIQALAEIGLIGPTTEVKKRADGQWLLASKVRGLLDEPKWYCRNAPDEEVGPIAARHLRTLARVGLIGPSTEIRKRSGGRWFAATKVRGLLDGSFAPASTPTELPRLEPPKQAGPEQKEIGGNAPQLDPAPSFGPPVQAEFDSTQHGGAGDRPGPVAWGDAMNRWDSPAATRSPLLHFGAGSLGTLLVVGFLMFTFDDRTPVLNLPDTALDPRSAERSVPPAETTEAESGSNKFRTARRLLLEPLSEVGGTPEANVKAGIELLTEHLAEADVTDREEAELLLEHARTALSDDKAISLLLAASDLDRSDLAGKSVGVGRAGLFVVPKSRLASLCPGFSTRLKTEFAEEGRETQVFITGQSYWAGGRQHNSIETAFYETLKKNVYRAIERVAIRRAAEREDKERRLQEKERQAVLQNGTDEFKQIVEAPQLYISRHYSFDGLFGSSLGNLRLQKESACYSVTFSCQNKLVPAVAQRIKDRLTFVVSDALGTKLLEMKDGESPARIYCRLQYGDPEAEQFPLAVIYKIEFFSAGAGKFAGVPKLTVE
jgi:hypothetical protein